MSAEHLLFRDYEKQSRQEEEVLHPTGFPASALLSKREQYEVLGFINHMAKLENWAPDNGANGHKVEKLLRQMPIGIRIRQQAYDWVKAHWHML